MLNFIPGTCWGLSSIGSWRLMKRSRPAAPNSRMDENMQASRIVPSRGVIRGTLRGHLLGVKGTFFPHYPHQTSIRLGSPVAAAGHTDDSKDTRLAAAAPGCSSRSLRGPLWLWGPTPAPHARQLGSTHVVSGPQAQESSVPVCLLHTGRSEQCRPSRLRATGDAARRETGCYGNLRRMEPGTAVTLNPAPCLLLR